MQVLLTTQAPTVQQATAGTTALPSQWEVLGCGGWVPLEHRGKDTTTIKRVMRGSCADEAI